MPEKLPPTHTNTNTAQYRSRIMSHFITLWSKTLLMIMPNILSTYVN